MATPSGSKDPDLDQYEVLDLMRDQPWSFQFFQAVRLMQRLSDREAVGLFAPPSDEAVRFAVNTNLAFPASQIQALEQKADEQPRLVVNFLGLTGPSGVLPHNYTELINERRRLKDTTLDGFLEMFQHRIISLFYRAWEKHRFPVPYERQQSDRFSYYLMTLIGLGTGGLQDRQVVPDQALLFYSGLLSMQTRSAQALTQILEDYFQVNVSIEEFVGSWCKLSTDDQCSLSMGKEFSEQMGLGVVVGDEIWDQQSRARIKIGPMPLERYRDFLPSGSAFQPLRTMTKFFVGEEIEFEVQLILERNEVPQCELGSPMGLQLGWVTWMKSVPSFDRNPQDTILLLT